MLTGIEILMANISTKYHRGHMMNDQGIVMHDKCIYQTDTRRPKDHPFLVNNALGTMFM